MSLEEIFELLEMESPLDFEYFEQFALLMECSEEISPGHIHTVVADAEPSLLAEMTENYFEDILQGIPDSASDFHLLMLSVQQSLCGLALAADDRDQRRQYADELHRFRQWYLFDSLVGCPAGDGPDETTVFDALTCCRIAKLENGEPQYDFGTALDYSVSDYVAPLGALPEAGSSPRPPGGDYDDYDGYGSAAEDEDYDDDYDETLIHRDRPVIDGQWSE